VIVRSSQPEFSKAIKTGYLKTTIGEVWHSKIFVL